MFKVEIKAIFIKDNLGSCQNISESNFLQNYAKIKGIIFIISSMDLYIFKCNFSNNFAQFGSGIYLELNGMKYQNNFRIIMINGCNFFNNSGKYGSSIYFYEGESIFKNF